MTDQNACARIDIENVGPIDEFHYEMTQPGLHVICGDQGKGKTTILRTVQLAQGSPLDRDVKPTVKDGADKARAEIAGKTLKIARTVRTEGELEFDGIGDLDLSTIAWPNLKTADKRDAHRIAALCSLAGVKPTTAAFQDVVTECKVTDDDWKEIVFDADVSDDIVATAGSFKRAIERRALEAEKTAAGTEAECEKLIAQLGDVDLTVETDAKSLQDDLDDAVNARQEITQRLEAQRLHADRVAEAEGKLETLAAAYDGPSREDAERQQIAAKSAVDDLDEQMATLNEQLSKLNRQQVEAQRQFREAQHVREMAEVHFDRVDELRETIESEPADLPTPDEVAKAETRYRMALDAVRAGELAREGLKTKERLEDLADVAKQQGKRGRRLRDAAASVAKVLTAAIQQIEGCPLFCVEDDKGNTRLAIKTERNPDGELFDELSDGQRYRVILETVCQPGRLFPLSQAAFGELSTPTRDEVAKLAAERGCYVLAAVATEGELRAHRWGEVPA